LGLSDTGKPLHAFARVSRRYELPEQRISGGPGILRRCKDEPHGVRLLPEIEGEERTACLLTADHLSYPMDGFGRIRELEPPGRPAGR
jgi:hypothetical protein